MTRCRIARHSRNSKFRAPNSRTDSQQRYGAHDLLLSPLPQLASQAFLPPHCQSEVDQLDVVTIFAQEQEVFRLKVPVGDFAAVEIIDSLGHLSEQDSGTAFGEAALLVEAVEQLPALAKTEWQQWYSVTR